MTVEQVYAALDGIFPFAKSGEYIKKYGGFDNSGIIINSGNSVSGALWALDFSKNALAAAKDLGYNLLITHHPAVYSPVNVFSKSDYTTGLLIEAAAAGISAISMHLNLDAAQYGTDFELASVFSPVSTRIVQMLDSGGYGRIITFNKISADNLHKKLSKELNTDKIRFYGDGEISKAAVFSGSGFSPEVFAENGLQLIVASEIKHHHLLRALDTGICAADIPHFASENYSFKKIYTKTKDALAVKSHYFEDGCLL